jgi:hypothetical protein
MEKQIEVSQESLTKLSQETLTKTLLFQPHQCLKHNDNVEK